MAKARFITDEETVLAGAFDQAGVRWQYEPVKFSNKQSHGRIGFRPDFYLPQIKMFVEVGKVSHDKKRKLQMMRKSHSNVRVVAVDNSQAGIFQDLSQVQILSLLNEMWVEQEYLKKSMLLRRRAGRCVYKKRDRYCGY